MGVRILEDKETGYKCLYCSTTMVVFGGIFYENEDVEEFLKWLKVNAQMLTDQELEKKVHEWRAEKCEVCGKVCDKEDFYKLCKRCQPALMLGRKQGQNSIIGRITTELSRIQEEIK